MDLGVSSVFSCFSLFFLSVFAGVEKGKKILGVLDGFPWCLRKHQGMEDQGRAQTLEKKKKPSRLKFSRENLNIHRHMATGKWPKNDHQKAPRSFSGFFAYFEIRLFSTVFALFRLFSQFGAVCF